MCVATAPNTAPRGAHDLGRRPVVVVETEHGRARQQFGQSVEEGGVGAVPRVDGLAGVTHHEEVATLAQPGRQQPPLCGVHVLELVHKEMAHPPPLGGGGDGVVLEQLGAGRHQVVEVDDAARRLGGDVGAVRIGDIGRRPPPRRGPPGALRVGDVVLGPDHAHLRPVHLGPQRHEVTGRDAVVR